MEPVPEVATVNWLTASAAWAGALFIALAGGLLTYFATVKAGLSHALETERMKLRYDILRRRVAEFDQAAKAWRRYTRENPIDTSLKAYIQIPFRDLFLDVTLCASLVAVSSREVDDTVPAAERFAQACVDLSSAIREGGSRVTRASEVSDTDANGISECLKEKMSEADVSLLDLQTCVDEAAEKRLQSMT